MLRLVISLGPGDPICVDLPRFAVVEVLEPGTATALGTYTLPQLADLFGQASRMRWRADGEKD